MGPKRGTGTHVELGKASQEWWRKNKEMLPCPGKQGKVSLRRRNRKFKDTKTWVTETMPSVHQIHFFVLLGTQLNYLSQTALQLTVATGLSSSQWNGARVIEDLTPNPPSTFILSSAGWMTPEWTCNHFWTWKYLESLHHCLQESWPGKPPNQKYHDHVYIINI